MDIYDQIPEQALAWHTAGKGAAIATVIETWGSAPRPVGSMLAINSDSEFVGSVSGGCVEGAVVVEAIDALDDGHPRILEYGVTSDEAFAVGLACGGTIRILVEPIGVGDGPEINLIEKLVEHRAAREPVAYMVNVADWSRKIGTSEPDLAEFYRTGKSKFDGDWFIGIHNPPLRMFVIGAVHIAQPLLKMAKMSGYETTLIDPREAFATPERFPDIRIVHEWPDAALSREMLDERCAVVTLSHDPKIDDPAIKAALASDVFYLGCLGSRRTHSKRIERLCAESLTQDDVHKIHAPVGANIGSITPAEIAISIMAEVTERLRLPETRR